MNPLIPTRPRRSLYAAAALFMALSLTPLAANAAILDTAIGAGIGTSVADVFGGGSGVTIQTSIESVTYESPAIVDRNDLEYHEVLGSVQGTGWGGEFQDLSGPLFPPPDIFASLAHYSYNIPFVLRWTDAWDGTLVGYAHGYSPLSSSVLFDSLLGDDNEARRVDIREGQYVSDAVVDGRRRHAFFAFNLTGMDRNGRFSAIATEGDFAGLPINPSVDVPIWRDMALVMERLLLKLSGRRVNFTIGVGHSGGALIMQWITSNRGFSLNAGVSLFDGGNFVSAYNPGSGTILEGVIALAGDSFPVHPQFPLSSKIILIGGNTDYAGVNQVAYAGRLLRSGVDLNSSIRVYQIGGLPHDFAEIVESMPNQNRAIGQLVGVPLSTDSERMAPVVAGAIDDMNQWLTRGTPPPRSRINGRALDEDGNGVADRIEFTRVDGTTTSSFPFVEDPSIDSFLGETFQLSAAGGFPGTVRRYAEVLEALDHAPGSLSLPYLRCRVGGYRFEIDATLLPFSDIGTRWRSLGRYRDCVDQVMSDVARQGLYDKEIGSNTVYTDEILSLFRK